MNVYTQYKLAFKKARLKHELDKIVITSKCTFVYHTGWIEFKQNSLQRLIAKIF